MNSRTTLALITMVSATSATGCYSTWDIDRRDLRALDGFRGQTIAIKSMENESVEFTPSTELRFLRSDGVEKDMYFGSIDIRGPILVGKERDSGQQLNLDLSRMRLVQARNVSPGKTLLAIGAIGAAIPLAYGAWVLICCYTGPNHAGRPLRMAGRTSPVRAPLALVRERGRRARMRDGDEATRAQIFAHWAQEASAECASIPAFLALARDLKMAGAPRGLIDAALRAAREEATHTKLCTALANRHASNPIVPCTPATPVSIDVDRESLLRRLALESFWDGSVAEGAAAAVARRSAPVARDEVTRLALQTIARDETNHAELAKHIVAYALDAGGRAVRDTLMESFENKRANEEAQMDAEIEDATEERLVDQASAQAYGLGGGSIAKAARIEAWEESASMLVRI